MIPAQTGFHWTNVLKGTLTGLTFLTSLFLIWYIWEIAVPQYQKAQEIDAFVRSVQQSQMRHQGR